MVDENMDFNGCRPSVQRCNGKINIAPVYIHVPTQFLLLFSLVLWQSFAGRVAEPIRQRKTLSVFKCQAAFMWFAEELFERCQSQ